MKKIILVLMTFMLWVSPVRAEQAASDKTTELPTEAATDFEGHVDLGYRGITQEGNLKAGEYQYIKSSAIGELDTEWDPLPQRFVLESYYLNSKDYFGEMDYAYRDVVVVNMYARDMFHNLDHYNFGPPSTTTNVSFTDKDPGRQYGVENALRKAFIRFKTPDFPFHLYAEVITVDREGTAQQRFLRDFSGGLDEVSQSRNIDWNTRQVRVGANSHLGPVEMDYSHLEKKFEAIADNELLDVYPLVSTTPIPHNLVPNLESSSDTLKVHSSYSGRLVLAGTYSSGSKKNEDSAAKVKFSNGAGDVTIMPVTSVILSVKYRHYDIDATNPDTVNNVTPTGSIIEQVRNSISSTRDVITGTVRYRATDRLTLRGEVIGDSTDRTSVVNLWDLPEKTTKDTAKLSLNYRVMNRVIFRADYSRTAVDNPAYDTDPDKSQTGTAALTWILTSRFNTLLSYSTVRESRNLLGAPLGGGERESARDQGLASFTMVAGSRSSITLSYAYFKNKVNQTASVAIGSIETGPFELDSGVPYADIAHVGSLVLTVAPADGVNVTASGSRSYSRGNFTLAGGAATNTAGIAELSDLKVIDSTYAAGVEMQLYKNVESELRYQYRKYDDRIDNTQDGTVKTVLATLSMKW